ncbi:hypothetical protein [Desulfopila sp. IMCC35008]|uniref:hypothetical protein n=1 Tax=Desulfopila sp. IMCC35008 TaxID=2653858 RepID=UPI0013D460F3|nr:hypothetical protein [Desulfopila sp. IMCC35008]
MASFLQIGDAFHLQITGSEGLQDVLDLDEAHWVAVTGPVSTINCDTTFLKLLDSDDDGRIRPEEIKDAIRFLFKYHQDHEQILPNNLTLKLKGIARGDEPGKQIYGSASKVLARLGKGGDQISLNDVRKIKEEVLSGGLDQAGIVLVEAARNDEEIKFIQDVLDTVGGVEHPCGKAGVNRDRLDNFLDQCAAFYKWRREAGKIGSGEPSRILPLGKKTSEAWALLDQLSKKLTQFFLLCDIKRLNPELLVKALETPEANVALKLIDIREAESYLENAPLTLLNDDGVLDLTVEGNPYFRTVLTEFTEKVVSPLLGEDVRTIDRQAFRTLKDYFEPYVSWLSKKPDVQVDGLTSQIIEEYVTNPAFKKSMEELIDGSFETSIILENLVELERLILYQGLLLPLTNSFVSFPQLYDPASRALFEMGTLVMDGRLFTLAMRVTDHEQHIETTKMGNIFVMYLDLFGADGKKEYEIAVPVTSGTRGNIHKGKWGIFNDISGREMHARVVDLVENPISVGEAMADPFVRIGRSILARLEEFSTKTEEKVLKGGDFKKEKKAKDGSTGSWLAGGGIAAAALGSSFAFITQTLAGLSLGVVLTAVAAAALLITFPVGISTYCKLSRRDLSTILEGSGWGVNTRMQLTREQARTFTVTPKRNI